jgi:hypothetical protein
VADLSNLDGRVALVAGSSGDSAACRKAESGSIGKVQIIRRKCASICSAQLAASPACMRKDTTEHLGAFLHMVEKVQ